MTLLFKIHYFLWYGAHTAIFGYESVFAQQYTNASTVQYGTLKMILPFLAVIVTPVVCARADRLRSHRLYFTLSLLLSTVTLFGYTFLPLTMQPTGNDQRPAPAITSRSSTSLTRLRSNYVWFGTPYTRSNNDAVIIQENSSQLQQPEQKKTAEQSLWSGPWIFFCINTLLFELGLAVTTCLSDSFAVLQAEEHGTSFGKIILWGTFGWAVSALLVGYVNQIESMPRLLPGILLSAGCLVVDLILIVFWPFPNDFKLDVIPIDAARSLTGSSSSGHREPSDYQPSNEANLINLGTELVSEKGVNQTRRRKVKSPVGLLAEEVQMKLKLVATKSGVEKRRILHQGEKNAYTSGSTLIEPDQIKSGPSIPSTELPLGSRMPEHKEEEQSFETANWRVQLRLFLLILNRRRTLIRFLVIFVFSGFFMSMQWNYFFLYLEQMFTNDFTLISALSMLGQSMLGELPFFILSRLVIAKMGRSHTLSISIMSIGIRFLIYRFVLAQVSMWCVFLADCLQGPSYGLFYVVMTEVGLEYSFCDDQTIARLVRDGLIDGANKRQVDAVRLALRSTVQSVAFACYEGLGVGLGSLAGGLLLAHYDFDVLWLSMAIAALFIASANVLIEVMCRESDSAD